MMRGEHDCASDGENIHECGKEHKDECHRLTKEESKME